MAFQVPAQPLTKAQQQLVEESTRRFETQLRDALGMMAAAVNVGRWVEMYRAEAVQLVSATATLTTMKGGGRAS